MNPFDFLNAINDTKKDMFEDPQANKDYNAFIINKGLSFFPDTILYANEMNQRAHIEKKWQFEFLKNSISKRKRFSKWHKKDNIGEVIKLIMKHYNISQNKAYEVHDLLSNTAIEEIRLSYETGGRS
jgi:hypothetical protein